jgi:HK97 family phage major capsid protein
MLANNTVAGSGSSQPFGVFTRMMGVTTNPAHIVVTTAGQLGAVDVRKAWQSLPQRWRANATWLAHSSVETLVKGFAAGSSQVDYAQTLTQDGTRISALEGRPFVSSDYCPNFAGVTTGTMAAAVVGDFKNGFRVVVRCGMEVENVQHVPNLPTSNVPTFQKGWFAYSRLGWDVVVNDSMRIIANS